MKTTKAEQAEAREYLQGLLKPGDTVHTILKHVSKSGMSRVIQLIVIKDNRPIDISWNAAKLLEGYDENHEGCKAGGCGMDMGFHLVYNLGWALFHDGYQCPGAACVSNDHSNSPYPARDGSLYHKDGGYALNQHWM